VTAADLLGRWLIVDWRQDYDDGRVTHPLGQGLRGFIEYGAREMFCVIEQPNRAPLAASQWTASPADKAAAYGSYFSYAGGWEIERVEDGEAVVAHHVRHSLYPNWEGGIQRRRARLRDGLLYLSARFEENSSEARGAHLIWRRAPG
jgi:hypothetical protein